MKKIILLCALLCLRGKRHLAKKKHLTLLLTLHPKHGKNRPQKVLVQFTKEDAAKGTYCLITLYKAVPGTADAKENFDLAWASLVKEMVTVSTLLKCSLLPLKWMGSTQWLCAF